MVELIELLTDGQGQNQSETRGETRTAIRVGTGVRAGIEIRMGIAKIATIQLSSLKGLLDGMARRCEIQASLPITK